MRPRLCLLLTTLVALPGCFPYHFTERPGARGRVLDADTQEPIAGAYLTITRAAEPGTVRAVLSARTDAHGVFVIAPAKVWGIWVLIGDEFRLSCQLVVDAPGHRSTVRVLQGNPMALLHDRTDYGDILLAR